MVLKFSLFGIDILNILSVPYRYFKALRLMRKNIVLFYSVKRNAIMRATWYFGCYFVLLVRISGKLIIFMQHCTRILYYAN